MPIHTVLGPISPDQLGPTSMHEHIAADFRPYQQPDTADTPTERRVTPATLDWVRNNPLILDDNMLLDDEDAVIAELNDVAALGGSGILEVTTPGIGRSPEVLQRVARATGLHVMMSCGWYVEVSHPAYVGSAGVDELAEILIRELTDGVDGTGIRPALMGEIGTGAPWTDQEHKVVRACGVASAATGAAVNVHLHPQGRYGVEVFELLVSEGASPDRVILGHMDAVPDRGYHRAAADTGAVLAFDCFGQEYTVPGHYQDPTDRERLINVEYLLADGRADQLVFACDVWLKHLMGSYGGAGYRHLLGTIVPLLRTEFGLSDAVVDQILVHNPRRLLNRP